MSLFSICIPTYEMGDYGDKFLEDNFNRLLNQSIQDFEIVISDQSNNSSIEKCCEKYSSRLNIKYIHNMDGRGKAAINLNRALLNATGEFVKILFQDDFFVDDLSLEKIRDKFIQENCGWVVNSFTHSHDRISFSGNTRASYNDRILYGVNTIGNPSNYCVKKDHVQMLDENLLYVVDCEMYYRTFLSCGLPGIVNDILVCAMHHQLSVEEKPEFRNLLREEVSYCIKKFNI